MRKIIFIYFIPLLICIGCYDDQDEYIPHINAYAFYETDNNPGIKIPDAGAKVFFYYRKSLNDFTDFTYNGDGVFIKNNASAIKPDLVFFIDENGSAFFIPEFMKNTTIIIESNYYKGVIASTCFSSTNEGAGFYIIFKPESYNELV